MRPEQSVNRWAIRTHPAQGDNSFQTYPIKILDVDYRNNILTIKDAAGAILLLPGYWMDENWEISDDPDHTPIWREAEWIMQRGYPK
jgi:hypothetical protein